MRLTVEQEKELHDLICSTFTVPELAILVRYSLGIHLNHLVAEGPLPQTVFELIAACQRLGVVEKLLDGVAHERKDNQKVQVVIAYIRSAVPAPTGQTLQEPSLVTGLAGDWAVHSAQP